MKLWDTKTWEGSGKGLAHSAGITSNTKTCVCFGYNFGLGTTLAAAGSCVPANLTGALGLGHKPLFSIPDDGVMVVTDRRILFLQYGTGLKKNNVRSIAMPLAAPEHTPSPVYACLPAVVGRRSRPREPDPFASHLQ